jgi:hypothetical protein
MSKITNTSTQKTTTNTSTTPSNPTNIDNIIQQTRGTNFDADLMRKQANQISSTVQRYRSEMLSTSRYNDTIIASSKEMYDEEIQTERFQSKYSRDDGSDNEERVNRNYRKSAVGKLKGNKKGIDSLEPEKKQDVNDGKDVIKNQKVIISEEYRRQILTSTELKEFMGKHSREMERVKWF